MRQALPVRKIASGLVILIIFGFLFRTLFAQWGQMSKELVRIDPFLLGISLVPALGAQAVSALLWRDALEALGPLIAWREAFAVMSFSALARYVPGRVWGTLGLMHLASGRGVSPARSFGALVLLNIILLLAAGVIAFGFLLGWRKGLGVNPWWLLPPLAMGFAAIHPTVLTWGAACILRLLHREADPIRMGYRRTLWLLIMAAFYWVLSALGIYILTLAIIPSYDRGPFFLLGALAISWVFGLLAFFSPSGLGVREGVMASLLGMGLPGSAAVLVALAVRGWLVLSETLAAGIAFWLERSR